MDPQPIRRSSLSNLMQLKPRRRNSAPQLRETPVPLTRTESVMTFPMVKSRGQQSDKFLHQLLQKQMWTAVNLYLSVEGKKSVSKKAARRSSGHENFNLAQNVLHVACQQKPPLSIIQKLTLVFPSASEEINHEGQTALHMAVMHDAPCDVIGYLIFQFPYAVSIQDDSGRTPLHLACERSAIHRKNYRKYDRSKDDIDPKKYHADVVVPLCLVAPSNVFMEKRDGKCILEYAIAEDADIDTVLTIQEATTRAEVPKALLRRSLPSICA